LVGLVETQVERPRVLGAVSCLALRPDQLCGSLDTTCEACVCFTWNIRIGIVSRPAFVSRLCSSRDIISVPLHNEFRGHTQGPHSECQIT
jgi:hypothetical protein